MKKEVIKITFTNSDKICLIDADSWHLISFYKWSVIHSYTKTKDIYYALATVYKDKKYTTILMHRLLTNCPAGKVVDHKNHDGLDNRLMNLRVCTYSENMLNARKYKTQS